MYEITIMPQVKSDYAEIFLFGDKHYGNKDQDRELLKESIDYILRTPNCYGVGVGDTLDNSLKDSYGYIDSKNKSIQEAFEEFKEDFEPLILANKYLGDADGNHDNARIMKATGSRLGLIPDWFEEMKRHYAIDPDGNVVSTFRLSPQARKELKDLPLAYGDPHLIVDSKVGRSRFVGFITHGAGGGSTPGAIANAMFKSIRELSDADWYAQGHFHFEVDTPNHYRPYYDRRNITIQTQNQFFVSTGAYQKKGGFAARNRMLNGGISSTILELYASPDNDHSQPKTIQSRSFRGLKQALQERKAKGFNDDLHSSV